MKLSKINGELHFSEKKNPNPPLTRKIGDWIYHFYWLVKLLQNNHFQICLRCSLYFMYENTTVLKTVLRVPTIGLYTLQGGVHCLSSVSQMYLKDSDQYISRGFRKVYSSSQRLHNLQYIVSSPS
jgi:hypothetical protein